MAVLSMKDNKRDYWQIIRSLLLTDSFCVEVEIA